MKVFAAFFLLFILFTASLFFFYSPEDDNFGQWDGDSYRKNAQLQEKWADRFFFQKRNFQGNEFVLDIGSGDGKLTARIADQLPDGYVVGIDNSESMILVAERDWGEVENLVFHCQDAEEEDFYKIYENKFDIVVSFSGLHWMKNQLGVLSGIHEVLKPQGMYYIRLGSKTGSPVQVIAEHMTKIAPYKEYFTYFKDPMKRYSIEEYRILLDLAGLSVTSLEDVEEKDKIVSKENLIKQLKSWLPHYHYLKQKENELAENFMEDLTDRYLRLYPPSQDGTITLYDHYLEVIGSKELISSR